MEVICIQDTAFYALVEEVLERLKEKANTHHDKWIGPVETMAMLRVKSKTTLQKLRDEGAIRFSQPEKKIILYDRDSILEYLDKHSKDKPKMLDKILQSGDRNNAYIKAMTEGKRQHELERIKQQVEKRRNQEKNKNK